MGVVDAISRWGRIERAIPHSQRGISDEHAFWARSRSERAGGRFAEEAGRRLSRWVACAAWIAFGTPLASYAQETALPTWTVDHYKHSAFSVDQGAPENVAALAQTVDGYLWVGSGGQGLTRFDGLKFAPFVPLEGESLLSPQVSALFATRNGGLWIGYEFRGVSFLRDGHLTHYAAPEGFKITFVNKFFEGYHGQIYAFGLGRLLAFNGKTWSPFIADIPKRRIHAAVADGKGLLWLAGEDRIFWCREDDCRPVDAGVGTPRRVINLAISPEDVLYASEVSGSTRRFRIDGNHLTELPALAVYTVAPSFDRHGGVWLPSLGDGVMRLPDRRDDQDDLPAKSAKETYKKVDGLTGDYVWPSLIDAEGDIWVGTQHGIDRFREVSLVNLATPPGLQSPKVVPGGSGEIWIGAGSQPLMRWDGESLQSTAVGTFAFAICPDKRTGKSWLAYSDGLWELTGRNARHVAPAPVVSKVTAGRLACGHDGHLLAMYQQPVGGYEWTNGQWLRRPELDIADMLTATPDGRFFVGHEHNRLLVIDGSGWHRYGEAEGLNIDTPKDLVTFNDAVIIGGKAGLTLFKNGRFQPFTSGGSRPFADVTGLALDDSGALWVHMPDGVARIGGDEVALAMKNPRHALAYRWLSSIDGMPGVPAQDNPSPSLTKGADGHLWFTSQSGIAWLDPLDLITNKIPPKPRIESLVVDGVRYSAKQAIAAIPPRPRTIEIDFNAPLLRAAEGGQFLYRLEGVDIEWQDAGNRREAFYSNLGPGDHKFQVRAANESGVWGESDTSLTFHIQPAFYETWWFRAICGLAILSAASIGYVLHIRQVTARLRIREDERMRIARDLHDTLLQSVQAMLARVETIKDRTTDLWARSEAEGVAEWGRQAVWDGRTKVARLRACDGEFLSPIREALDVVRDLSGSVGMVLQVNIKGSEPALNASAGHEVASVIREISSNAIRHSGGENLWISINYGAAEFTAIVKDDGRGIDAAILAAGEKDGHWGLKGARERLCSLGGTLDIQVASMVGTEITIQVPARRLYQRRPSTSHAQIGGEIDS